MAGEKAQKRGGGSAGGGSGVNKFLGNSETAGHLDERYNSDNDERAQYLQEALGLSEAEAMEMAKAFDEFTTFEYGEIRKALYNNDSSHSGYAKGQLLEDYISMSPKYYEQGAIYRGMKMKVSEAQEFVNTLSEGGVVDMRGPSSWSSKINVAKNFASTPSEASILVKLPNGTKAGASIRHLSQFFNEDEILVSNRARFSASRIVQTGTYSWEIDLVETVV